MVAGNLVLIPGAGGVGGAVFEHLRAQDVPVRFMVRREDERAAEVSELGAEVVIGDLTRPETVADALQGASRMTATSTAESHQQRPHPLAEQVLNWSGLPVVHIRPTVFLDTPLFTTVAARSIRESVTIALLFGTGRTSPVAVDDVARVVATVLRDPLRTSGGSTN